TAHKEAHSGMAGGVARNPIRELCVLAAAIQGAAFWKAGVVPPDAAELADFMASGFDPEYFRQSYGLDKMETSVPLEMMLRIWARPTFEVHGLAGGYVGPGVKTAVPKEAELKFSFRMVHDQNPAAIMDELRRFVHAFNPDVELIPTGQLPPYMGDLRGPLSAAVRTGMTRAFGKPPVAVREGGAIGAVPMMAATLGVPIAFLPLSLPEHGYHAPDECFDWLQAAGGIRAYVHTFAALAQSSTR
ncbi:MAG TPA: peptidase dimerization domain-containing protein, partial [Candidatus Eisenbacteria bacterium]